MARSAPHEALLSAEPVPHKRSSWLHNLFERFLWAAEAQAIARIEREAGHLFSREDLARMKRDLIERRPW